MFGDHRDHFVDRRVNAGGGGMAARLHLLVAGIVGDAVDHRLRPRVHVLVTHVGETRDVLEALGRQRQRERLAEIGAAGWRKFLEDAVGVGLELPAKGGRGTVRGDTDGNIAVRSDMCASPSLRIMLWPINVFINPAG